MSLLLRPLVLLLSMVSVAAFAGTSWYATTSATANKASPIGTEAVSVRLADGRACSIATVGEFGGRQVVCDRGAEKIQFSVQCDANRAKDHVQVRFTSQDGKLIDFIEVGCERSSK